MKVSPVERYGLQLTRFGLVNCYLVREDDGYTLVDANLRGSEDGILKAAAGVPIRRILLTHAHDDHVGAVDALMARIPGVVLACSERSVPILRIPPDLSLRPGEAGAIAGRPKGIRASVSRVIAHGEKIGSLQAIDTPGHIHGHLAFLDERDGTLYAGDEFAHFGELRITGWSPWWLPMKAFSDRAQARNSAVRLLRYPIRRIAPGHGSVDHDGWASMREAIERTRR